MTPRGGAAPNMGGAMRFGDIPPNQTLYVQGLNEKIKVHELKCCIFELFSTYGEVLDVVAAGSWKKKGQAFVVFRDISCATNALRALQAFVFLDKPMRIVYCRTKSDIISLEDGTFKPRNHAAEAVKDQPAGQPKAKAAAMLRPGLGKAPGGAPPARPAEPNRGAVPKAGSPPPAAAATAPKAEAAPGEGQPSNVLFVENLPAEVNEMMLTMLFRQYPGFQEARLIKGRNVAFIEYADELQAGIAKHGLQGFMVTPEMALKIAFAKQ